MHLERYHEDGGRGWRDAPTSQGLPATRSWGRRGTDSSLNPSEGTSSADLQSILPDSRTMREWFSVVLSHHCVAFCYSSHRKWIHPPPQWGPLKFHFSGVGNDVSRWICCLLCLRREEFQFIGEWLVCFCAEGSGLKWNYIRCLWLAKGKPKDDRILCKEWDRFSSRPKRELARPCISSSWGHRSEGHPWRLASLGVAYVWPLLCIKLLFFVF